MVKSKTSPEGSSSLIIVESPAKARTIGRYLGKRFVVKASVGHIKDLPKSKLGIDVDNDFNADYEILKDKKKIVSEIRTAAKNADKIFLAPDPDREGEAIAGHIYDEVSEVNSNVFRVLFHEITPKGIAAALDNPSKINTNKIQAQQARRILDRLIGYQISPLLWKKVRRGLSAGRVQSVTTGIVIAREKEISIFVPQEYWSVEADCESSDSTIFSANTYRYDNKKVELKTGDDADKIVQEVKNNTATVIKVEKKERKKNPLPPFVTATLQQDVARKLRFTAKRTMALAQRLYEGIEGATGLITYMRTDSVRISDDAINDVRTYIAKKYGEDYLPAKPVIYKNKRATQDAHEGIRPTLFDHDPKKVRALLEQSTERDVKALGDLYELIWNRFVSCQMVPAKWDQTAIDIECGRVVLRANGQILKFSGHTAVYQSSTAQEDTNTPTKSKDKGKDKLLPALNKGDVVTIKAIHPEQHFTKPPARFSEASLVKELEEKGIGRPSTYASTLSTIVDRAYVEKKEGKFFPTELGEIVNELLTQSFPNLVDTQFTAEMEHDLDRIEEGDIPWRVLLKDFYGPFRKDLDKADETMRDVKREEIPTDLVCEKCSQPMVKKWGKYGSFLACTGYPDCRNTKELEKTADGSIKLAVIPVTDELCETCNAPLVVKRGKFGSFLACSRYPECKTTKPISLGVDCPKEGCGGFLVERRSKRSKVFFGCSNYHEKKCEFNLRDRPIPTPCPECDAKFLTQKENRKGIIHACATCDYKQSSDSA